MTRVKHPVGAGPVDARVRQRKGVRVARTQVHIGVVRQSVACPIEHDRVVVDPDDGAVLGDRVGQPAEIRAGSATGVEHHLPRRQVR
jgi:hypothetical protein